MQFWLLCQFFLSSKYLVTLILFLLSRSVREWMLWRKRWKEAFGNSTSGWRGSWPSPRTWRTSPTHSSLIRWWMVIIIHQEMICRTCPIYDISWIPCYEFLWPVFNFLQVFCSNKSLIAFFNWILFHTPLKGSPQLGQVGLCLSQWTLGLVSSLPSDSRLPSRKLFLTIFFFK